TSATRQGDSYVLEGKKIVVLNGPAADKLAVVVRTSGSATDHTGISVLLVDADSEGVHRRNYTAVDGHRAAEIKFDKVSVPAGNLLGEEGKALAALEQVIDRATLAVCA